MAHLNGIVHFSNSMLNTDKRHKSSDAAPAWLWGGTLAAAAVILAATLLSSLAIALGATDPPRAAHLQWASEDWPAEAARTLAPGDSGWADAPIPLPIDAGFTLEVRARLAGDADPGAAWGVWLEAVDGARIVYALSGEGFLTTRGCPPGDLPPAIEDCPALRPEWRWTAYPRLKPPGETNQITVHREQPGQVRLWINRERLGVTSLAPAGAWGVWWRGGRATSGMLAWERAELYQE